MRIVGKRKVAVGAAALAAVVGIGIGVVVQQQSAFARSTDQPSAASEALQAKANAIFESFNGTVRQRNASGALQAWSLNGAMDECMEGAGFAEWDWSETRNIAPRTNALATSVFFSAPLDHSYSLALMDMVEASRAEEKLRTETFSADETAAIDSCMGQTPETSDDEAAAASTPDGVAELRTKWWTLLRSLDEKYGDMRAYNECFAQGVDAMNVTMDRAPATSDGWQIQLAQVTPAASKTPANASARLAAEPEWEAFIETEADLESIDWTCRESVYEENLDSVDAAISAFETDHADEIEQARAAWMTIEKRAAAIGFHGQAGSLD